MKGQRKMTQEIKEQDSIKSQDENSNSFSGVFSSEGSEGSLAGSEYIGSFDDLLQSLGITPISKMSPDEIAIDEQAEKRVIINETKPEKQEYVPYNEDTYLADAEKKEKNAQQSKRFMQNFRVLSKKAEDKTLLEAVPTGKAGGNVADNINPSQGEDIFEAVEKAQSRKKRGVFTAGGKSAENILDKANKKKKEEAAMKAKELAKKLSTQMARQKIQLIALIILAALGAVLTILPSFYAPEGPLEFLFKNDGRVFFIINLALLALSCVAGYDTVVRAFKTLKGFKVDSNTGLFFMLVFVLAHTLVLMIFKKAAAADVRVYTVYFSLSLVAAVLSEKLKSEIALRNLSVAIKAPELQSIQSVENKLDRSVLAKGLGKKNCDKVLYCAQADTISGLNGDFGKRSGEDKFYNLLHLTVLAASLIAGVVIMIRSKDATMFVTAIVSCICLCGPIMCECARTVLLYIESKKINSGFAAVTSYEGLKTMDKASAIAMDASDVFTAKVSKFRAVRGSRLSTHDCAVLTAAALKESGSLLWGEFRGFEETIEGELPEAFDLEYTERLGYKCQCAGREVMVGNRKMLLKNNIDAPSKEEEKRYAAGKSAMYVVIDGILSATFLVAYNVIPSLGRAAVGFNKSSLVLLLTTSDPCITESLVSLKLGSDISSVKILSEDASELMDEYRLNRSMRQSNCLICSGRKKSLFSLAVSAKALCEKDKFVLYMHTAGQALAFIMLILSVIISVPAFMSPFVIIGLQLIWGALSLVIAMKK